MRTTRCGGAAPDGRSTGRAAASVAARRPIVLAGGLNPDNVADAIERVRPFGIDVSSGVEAAPGVKDHGRLKQLFDAIREAESATSHHKGHNGHNGKT